MYRNKMLRWSLLSVLLLSLTARASANEDRANKAVVVLIDVTGSMSLSRSDGRARLEHAKEDALDDIEPLFCPG